MEKKPSKVPVWVWIVSGVFVAGLIGSAARPKKKKPAAGTTEAAAAKVAGEPTAPAPSKLDAANAPSAAEVSVTVRQFVEDYKANEIAADAKYRDKILNVTGIVGGIAKDDLGRPFVGFVGPGQDLLKAIFTNEDSLGALKKTDIIAARCRGQNFGRPELNDCVLLPPATTK